MRRNERILYFVSPETYTQYFKIWVQQLNFPRPSPKGRGGDKILPLPMGEGWGEGAKS